MSEETVADVLYEISEEETPEPLYDLTRGAVGSDELAYEDWARPLKLTGGRVCLRIEWEGNEWFLSRCHTGHLLAADPGSTFDDWDVVGPPEVKRYMADPSVTLTPVLREDTPFAEADHE